MKHFKISKDCWYQIKIFKDLTVIFRGPKCKYPRDFWEKISIIKREPIGAHHVASPISQPLPHLLSSLSFPA